MRIARGMKINLQSSRWFSSPCFTLSAEAAGVFESGTRLIEGMKNLLNHLTIFGVAAAAFAGLLAFGSHGSAAEPVTSSGGPTANEAYQQLLSTKFFAFGGVGFAGTTSEGERAFHAIAASTNALELFTAVLAQGNTQSQLYALCGIRRLAPEKFDVLAKAIVVANPKVSTMAGCVGRDDRASNVVAHIAGGLYDLYIGGTNTGQRSNPSVQHPGHRISGETVPPRGPGR